jgi:6-phosphogluconolactonase
MKLNIQSFNPDDIAETYSGLVSAESSTSLAIPGGRSPGKVLTPLASKLSPAQLQQVHLFWVDERCVPVGHEDRNDLVTLKAWEAGGPLPAQVHSMPAEQKDLASACSNYGEKIDKHGFGEGLDLCLLGIGPDGHFASLFPDHEKQHHQGKVFSIEDSPKPPPQRLSLSLNYILMSKRIDVLVLGADKGEILKKGVAHPTSAIPFSLLLEHSNLTLHLDEAARTAFDA